MAKLKFEHTRRNQPKQNLHNASTTKLSPILSGERELSMIAQPLYRLGIRRRKGR
jgi:hypothetical protein